MAQKVIQLPENIYDAVQEQAVKQQKTPDSLVTEWVSAHLDSERQIDDDKLAPFEREIAAFENMKPELLQEYPGQYVAIHNGEVVANGKDKLAVSRQVREQYGQIVYYVELVSSNGSRKVRMPMVRVSRK